MRATDQAPVGPVLVIIESHVGAEHEAAFNEWYDHDHLPAVLGCPGFLAGSRYMSTSEPDTYLALYVLEDLAALTTPEVRSISGFGELTPHVTYQRKTFRLLTAALAEGEQED